jgi:hypothetical protein
MMPTNQRPGIVSRIMRALVAKPAPRQVQQRNYAAAQVNRLTHGWSVHNSSANADIFRSLDKLRARSRLLAQNDEYVKRWLSMVCTNVVGPAGFRFQARVYNSPGQPDQLGNDAIEAAWQRWSKVCDVAGRSRLIDLLQINIKAVARDGECLIHLVRGAEAGNPFGLALQLLDVNRLDTQLQRPESPGVNAIRMGIEVNRYNRPLAYWLRIKNPGDVYGGVVAGASLSTHERFDAADIIHAFISDDAEQVRGVPWAHAAMMRLNNRGGYEEAAIIAARVGASKMGFFTTPDGQAEVLSTGKIDDGTEGDEQPLAMDADAGTFQSLPEGVQFTPFNPEYPTAMFADFIKANLRGTASGLGVAYHALANDLEGVSFSSIRSGTLEERDSWMVIQEWFVGAVMERIHGEFMAAALSFGQITMPNGSALPLAKREKFMAHTFQGRRWEWVEPRADIEADINAINAGLKSPQSVAAKLGLDYEDLLIEIKAAADMRKRLGVELAGTPNPQQLAAAAGAAAGQANATPKE